MFPPESVGILAALTSAVVWGSGDFAGGLAARRNTPIHVLMLASLSGLLILLPSAFLRNEPIPTVPSIAWSCLAGISGGLGIAVLYRALSTGPAALVAPTAGVVGAAVPVVAGSFLEGLPTTGQLVGLFIGLGGIWLVSRGAPEIVISVSSSLALALVAGVAFGGYFVFIAQVRTGSLFAPLVIAKLAALALAAILLLAQRQSFRPKAIEPIPFVAGVLDAGGNLFYLLAVQYARLDVAAVVSSMYPAATVILTRLVRHERISNLQSLGIGLCVAAVAFIAAY